MYGYLGKKVKDIMDRPLGSKHPEHGFIYSLNYGYIHSIEQIKALTEFQERFFKSEIIFYKENII